MTGTKTIKPSEIINPFLDTAYQTVGGCFIVVSKEVKADASR